MPGPEALRSSPVQRGPPCSMRQGPHPASACNAWVAAWAAHALDDLLTTCADRHGALGERFSTRQVIVCGTTRRASGARARGSAPVRALLAGATACSEVWPRHPCPRPASLGLAHQADHALDDLLTRPARAFAARRAGHNHPIAKCSRAVPLPSSHRVRARLAMFASFCVSVAVMPPSGCGRRGAVAHAEKQLRSVRDTAPRRPGDTRVTPGADGRVRLR
jgi:hypothetical protein